MILIVTKINIAKMSPAKEEVEKRRDINKILIIKINVILNEYIKYINLYSRLRKYHSIFRSIYDYHLALKPLHNKYLIKLKLIFINEYF
jgi:site-specific DNA-adenine methylase